MKFKTGDKVRVVPGLVIGKEYDFDENRVGTRWIVEKEALVGSVLTIKEVVADQMYYKVEENGMVWSDSMLEDAGAEDALHIPDPLVLSKPSMEEVLLELSKGISGTLAEINKNLKALTDAMAKPTQEPEELSTEAKEPAVEELSVPKMYNGKVICLGAERAYDSYTACKIYQFKDGKMTDDCGNICPTFDTIHSFSEWQRLSIAEWAEVTAEQETGWNARVFCVESIRSDFTAGKIYNVSDSMVTDDDDCPWDGARNIDKLNDMLRGEAKFIEVVDHAD